MIDIIIFSEFCFVEFALFLDLKIKPRKGGVQSVSETVDFLF